MTARNDIHIVIATHDRTELLERTLKSLSECELPSALQSTIVVENGKRAGSEAIVERSHKSLRAKYLFHERGNKSAALNDALQDIHQGLIIFLDDDVRLHPQTLLAYEAAWKTSPEGKFFGGPTLVDYEQTPPEWLQAYFPHSARSWSIEDSGRDPESLLFLGFNWAANASDLHQAGGFNPNKGPGSPTKSVGQETDMQLRLIDQGVKSEYTPDALVWHYVPVNRCSEEWTLERAFKMGVHYGGLKAGSGPWRRVRWQLSSALKSLSLYGMYPFASSQFRFRQQFRIQNIKGKLHGLQVLKKAA